MSRWQEIGIPVVGLLVIIGFGVVVTMRDVRRWGGRSGLELGPTEVPVVRRSIRSTRLSGLVGGLIGFLAVPLAVGAPIGSLTSWLTAAGAMVAMTVVGELRTHRPSGAVRSASLAQRDVAGYSPARVGEVSRAAALAAMVLVAIASLVPGITVATDSQPDGLRVLAILLAAPLTVVLIEWAQRWIAARPQPAGDERSTRLDDAIRARSIHVLAGAELFLELQLLAVALWAVGFRRQWTAVAVVAGAIAVVGLVASVRVSNRQWTGRVAVTS